MSDILDDKKDNGQSMKATEITGKRFLFHSLPKEFQDWHTTYFILEQRGQLDSNSVSKAVINGYMWKTFSDATFYGFLTGIAIILAIFKLKFSPNIMGFTISMLMYLPWYIYTCYHFTFYAYIRAQVIGEVTETAYKNTSLTFYTTFTSIVVSMVLAAVLTISFLDEVHLLIGNIINYTKGDGINIFGYTLHIKGYFVSFYNVIDNMLKGPSTWIGSFFFNEWLMGILFTSFSFIGIYFFEKERYEKHREKTKKEVERTKATMGYPIEVALEKLWKWRKDNGV